jgi:hypothetical protein
VAVSEDAPCDEDEARRDVQGWREGLIEITRADASARAAGSLPRRWKYLGTRPQGVRDAVMLRCSRSVAYCKERVWEGTTAIKVWQSGCPGVGTDITYMPRYILTQLATPDSAGL